MGEGGRTSCTHRGRAGGGAVAVAIDCADDPGKVGNAAPPVSAARGAYPLASHARIPVPPLTHTVGGPAEPRACAGQALLYSVYSIFRPILPIRPLVPRHTPLIPAHLPGARSPVSASPPLRLADLPRFLSLPHAHRSSRPQHRHPRIHPGGVIPSLDLRKFLNPACVHWDSATHTGDTLYAAAARRPCRLSAAPPRPALKHSARRDALGRVHRLHVPEALSESGRAVHRWGRWARAPASPRSALESFIPVSPQTHPPAAYCQPRPHKARSADSSRTAQREPSTTRAPVPHPHKQHTHRQASESAECTPNTESTCVQTPRHTSARQYQLNRGEPRYVPRLLGCMLADYCQTVSGLSR